MTESKPKRAEVAKRQKRCRENCIARDLIQIREKENWMEKGMVKS